MALWSIAQETLTVLVLGIVFALVGVAGLRACDKLSGHRPRRITSVKTLFMLISQMEVTTRGGALLYTAAGVCFALALFCGLSAAIILLVRLWSYFGIHVQVQP